MLNETAYCLFCLFKYIVLVYLSNLWVSESHSRNINMTATMMYSLPVHKLIHKISDGMANIIHITVLYKKTP